MTQYTQWIYQNAWPTFTYVKIIYSEKAIKFWENFTLLLSYLVPVKSEVEISQNFVAISEYMNFDINPWTGSDFTM